MPMPIELGILPADVECKHYVALQLIYYKVLHDHFVLL